ncbi:putative prophage phiRv2 integrase [Aliarcobacter thereius]|uniref:site-specific integrase n=1 Tax=Aliarcobacter thereius TaxID=544718 RepID=UPI0008291E7A|nr:site-specific integrase [Aliarcobacter thereius]OCL85703.1 putative prophage phiRv2 integrase [Aliarcobacter thereius]
MKLYNRNGILYIYLNGVRKSSGLKDTKENRKLLENHHKRDEFYIKFDVKTKGKTVIEFCEEVLREKDKRLQPTTMLNYYSQLRKNIVPFFDKKYPQEITPYVLKNWYSTFTDKSTLNTCVNAILKPAFELAVIEEYIKTSPFIVSFPTLKSNYEINPFNIDEIKLILNNSKGVFRNILGVSFFTGMRTGEVLALKWEDIDFINKRIDITKTRTMGLSKKPKTKSSIRNIDMIQQCEYFLREQRKLTGLRENIFLDSNDKLFYGSVNLNYRWADLLKKLDFEHRGIYQTRHSFASNMLSNKENPLWVSQMLGHKSLTTTLDIYTKYIRREDKRAKTTFLDDINISFCTNVAQHTL